MRTVPESNIWPLVAWVVRGEIIAPKGRHLKFKVIVFDGNCVDSIHQFAAIRKVRYQRISAGCDWDVHVLDRFTQKSVAHHAPGIDSFDAKILKPANS